MRSLAWLALLLTFGCSDSSRPSGDAADAVSLDSGAIDSAVDGVTGDAGERCECIRTRNLFI